MRATAGRPAAGSIALVAGVVLLAGCAGLGTAASPTPDATRDKLAQVQARGTLVLSTDLAYSPQSMAVEGATRPSDTRCAANQLTAAEVAGYDADTGKLVAEALGVEPCFVTPPWSDIIGGNWGDRWDVAWGSGALSAERMERLYVTQPYYSTPHAFFLRADSPAISPGELSGKRIGACAGCTHELYLRRELELPGGELTYAVDDPVIVTYDAEPAGLDALAAGEIDAFLCGEPVGQAKIAAGLPLRMLEPPAYHTMKTGYIDRGLALAPGPFIAAINDAIAKLHADGRLRALSGQYFGVDYATAAAEFDLASVAQSLP